MKAKEIRNFTLDELNVKVKDLSEEFNKLKFQHGFRPLENTAKLKDLRKDISRLRTIITEKTIAR